MTGLDLPSGDWRGKALAAGILVLLVGLVWVALAAPVLAVYAERQVVLDDQRGLAARMERTAADLPELKARAAKAPASATTVPMAARSDALSFAGLAAQIQQIAADSHVTLTSTEAIAGSRDGAHNAARASVRLTGAYADLIGLLRRLALAAPEILVDGADLQGSGDPGGTLTIHLDVHIATETTAG